MTSAFVVNEFENRVNALVSYRNKRYAVSCLTSKQVNADNKYTIYTKSIVYLEKGVTASAVRDREIIRALNKATYNDYKC